MQSNSTFQGVISALLDRGAKLLEPFGVAEDSTLIELCEVLLSSRGEASGVALASRILARYKAQSDEEKQLFFEQLAEQFDPDLERVNAAVQRYSEERSSEALSELNAAVEPPRQELLRRINQSPGGTAALVSMRADLLPLLKANPTLKRIDNDFAHLLSSWFNRGFLQMQPVTWSSPADILEKIIDYEAVHEIPDWAELRRRLQPSDRRCYAFFHPAMPDEPLVFVEVALTTEAADNITELLSDGREIISAELANTAVFYSISNCQVGLRGVSFGNFLIKQVVADLLRDLPNLKTFVTLSPAPGFAAWLNRQTDNLPEAKELLELSANLSKDTDAAERKRHAQLSKQMAAEYYLKAKRGDNSPEDPVARFHLGNGASLDRINAQANLSPAGMKSSVAMMVNYRYDLARIEENHEAYAANKAVTASRAVRSLLSNNTNSGAAKNTTEKT